MRLSPETRKKMATVISDLFVGRSIQFPREDGESTTLCFRAAGEEMPYIETASLLVHVASETGLYFTASGSGAKTHWRPLGDLGRIAQALEHLCIDHDFLDSYLIQRSFQAVLVECDMQAALEAEIPTGAPPSREQECSAA